MSFSNARCFLYRRSSTGIIFHMTARVYRLDEYRLRRHATAADNHTLPEPGAALGKALRAVAASKSRDFKANASIFQRAFREAIEQTNAQLRGHSQADGSADGDGEL